MTRINLDVLKQFDAAIYNVVSKNVGYLTGTHSVDIGALQLPADARFRLAQWSVLHEVPEVSAPRREFRTANATPPAPEPPKLEPTPSKSITPLPSEAELLQEVSDQTRGLARMEQFCVEQGLERTPENAAKVQQWLDANSKEWSQQNVDVAVLAIAKELSWGAVEVPAPEPTEVLSQLEDGSMQLPLDANASTMRRASVKQLHDLIARRRKATNQVYVRKGHGASFF